MEKINGEELLKHFQIIDSFSPEWKDYGLRTMVLAGWDLRERGEELILRIIETLPRDVRLYVIDGVVLRGDPYGRDQWRLLFASKEWEWCVASKIPEIQCLFIRDNADKEILDSILYYTRPDTSLDIKLNKKTHVLEIPKDRETEEYLTIVLRPI